MENKEVFFDVQSIGPTKGMDQLVTEITELIAKAATSALVLYVSLSELSRELTVYKNSRSNK